jgi:hypothetical protein
MSDADFDALHAKMAGKPYRPSNGTEGEIFMCGWCDRCERDRAYRNDEGDSCPIVAAAFAYSIGEPGYPKEWVYAADGGGPVCTAFVEEGKPTGPTKADEAYRAWIAAGRPAL